MFDLFHQVFAWYNRRQERKTQIRSEQDYNSGFTWAMQELTQRGLTCEDVCHKCASAIVFDDFDRGALHAVSVFRSVEHAASEQFKVIEQRLGE